MHLCICVSWSHLGWSSLHAGLCLYISCPTLKSTTAAHFSLLHVTAHWWGAAVSLPGLQTFPSVLYSWLPVGTDRRCCGLWAAVQHCTMTLDFLRKRREAHWFLKTSDVFSGKTEAAVRVLWEEIQYRPNVLFKSLTKDRDIPVTNQNEQLLSKDRIMLSTNPPRGKAEKLRLVRL